MHYQTNVISLEAWDLLKWSPKGECTESVFQILSTNSLKIFKKMYRNLFGEFVCAYRGLKGFNLFLEVRSPWERSRRPSVYFPAVQFRLVSRFFGLTQRLPLFKIIITTSLGYSNHWRFQMVNFKWEILKWQIGDIK